MKIPKKPDFSKKPYPTRKECIEWENFMNLIILIITFVFMVLTLLTLFF